MITKPYVFTDFHHASLLNSLIMLFEKRLGGQVFRPIGMDWATQGFWKIYDHPETQQQFLGIGGATPDGTPPLNEVQGLSALGGQEGIEPIYLCKDIEGDVTNKAITLGTFMSLPIDIVIASIPAHLEPFKRLCELHPNKPKLIFQIGNAWTVEAGLAKNVMASAVVAGIPPTTNFITYHQEFDLSTFYPQYNVDNSPSNNIYSFINCFNTSGAFQEDWQLFQHLEQTMPEWNFKSFGGQCRDGSCNGTKELAETMRQSKFIWHTKNGGDGYGHVLHNSAAVGRPLITKKLYYAGKMGERLMVEGKTCINIDFLSIDEIRNKIEYYSDPELYNRMCRNVYENFRMVCDFDSEFEGLQKFLDNLL